MKLQRLLLIILLATLSSSLFTWQVGRYAYDWSMIQLKGDGEDRLLGLISQFRAALDEYKYLPFLISQNREVKELLLSPSPDKIAEVSRYLEQANLVAGSTALFILDRNGQAKAFSYWRQQRDFYLISHAQAPYFVEAKNGLHRIYLSKPDALADGAFYLSASVYDNRHFAGVATVRINLDVLQPDLPQNESYMISQHGRVLLASDSHWVQQEVDTILQPFRQQLLSDDVVADIRKQQDGQKVLVQSIKLDDLQWQMSVITNIKSAHNLEQTARLYSLGGCIAFALFLLWLRERHLKNLSRLETRAALEQANNQLEQKVQERTQALKMAQDELVQAEKMAALGRMSSAVVHELNQPLTAMRTYVSICRHLLAQQMTAQNSESRLEQSVDKGGEQSDRLTALQGCNDHLLDENLVLITQLTERMAVLTRQLKTFAYKKPEQLSPVDPVQVLNHILPSFQERLAQGSIQLECVFPDQAVSIAGDNARLEQIFSNLITNACDAMASERSDQQHRLILSISAPVETDQCVTLQVIDTGPGITVQDSQQLFEPFYTSKAIGDGLGLGLSIVRSIVKDLQGEIRVANSMEGGACFTVRLPIYTQSTAITHKCVINNTDTTLHDK